MAVIGRSLDELSKQIKSTRSEITATNKELAGFDKALKLNPGNVDLVRQKYQALDQAIQLNTTRIVQLKQRQAELAEGLRDGTVSQTQYEKQIATLNKQIAEAEKSITGLTAAVQKKNQAVRDANYTKLIDGLGKAEQKAKTFSKAALAVVGALSAIVASAVSVADELDDNAAKYGTTAEQLQIQSNRFMLLTSDTEAYTSSLVKLGSIQSSIAAGRGARYLTYLEQLGIGQEDLAHKTNAEIYNLVFAGLQKVNDETDRGIIAQGLLGDVGLDVANVAALNNAELRALDETLIASGIISSEQAAVAGEVADKFDLLKRKYTVVAAEVMVALLPAIETLTVVLQSTVIPLISATASWLDRIGPSGQKIVMVILFMLIILPKLIAVIKTGVTVAKAIRTATLAQSVASATLSAASAPLIPIFLAIGVALLALIAIIALFSKRANEGAKSATSLLNSAKSMDSQLKGMGYDLDYSAEQTSTSNTYREVDINVHVEAEGDGTKVNEETAERISGLIYDQISIDLINQALGAVAR